jgi:hypothetical protein
MADVFISYAKTDRPLASKLVAMLGAEGWKVWWDTSLTIGDDFRNEVKPISGAVMGREGTMTGKGRRIVGLLIASLVILVGLWLCVEGVWHGKLSAIFWIGPFLIIAGGLWFASDWFDNERGTKSNQRL